MKNKKLIFFLIIYPLLASLISNIFSINLLVSIILFYAIPSIILSIKNKKIVKKSFLFALIIIPIYIAIESIGTISKTWKVNTLFSFSIFGTTIEGILWAFFTIYLIIIFYETFLDYNIKEKSNYPRLKFIIILSIFIFGLFFIFLTHYNYLLNIPYFYLILGIIIILIPSLSMLFSHRRLINKFLITGSYFFFFHLVYEITALKLGWWSFPGTQVIGRVSLLGVTFPFEEFLFFILFLVLAVLSYYEFFDDDEK